MWLTSHAASLQKTEKGASPPFFVSHRWTHTQRLCWMVVGQTWGGKMYFIQVTVRLLKSSGRSMENMYVCLYGEEQKRFCLSECPPPPYSFYFPAMWSDF